MNDKANILFVDDDPQAGELFVRFAHGRNFYTNVYHSSTDALEHFLEHGADLVISDLSMPDMDGLELLRAIKDESPDTAFIIITGYSTVDNAIEALRLGATDFIKKPYDLEELTLLAERTLEYQRLKRENRLLRRQVKEQDVSMGMVGHSPLLKEVQHIIEKVSDVRCNIIIEGESGTGKELVARAIHHQSQDSDQPFVVIDCGALNEMLLESELFGHEKGAFTGANHSKEGLLALASGGTVFLDEISNISDAMQTKLLRVIEEQTLTPVGSVKPISIDVQFIAATNRSLENMITTGEFREDLYHRLNVVRIQMPPLRARPEDIPLLAQHFLEAFAQQYHRPVGRFDGTSMERLTEYTWPGNIRELKNLVERLVALADSDTLVVESLGEPLVPHHGHASPTTELVTDQPTLEGLERRYILQTLQEQHGNKEKTARVLGINKSTLWRRLQRYGQ